MPSQSQYVDSEFLFPHAYREGNKCIGWSKSRRRFCDNPISQRKHDMHLSLMEQLNQLSLAEQITSPLLEQAVELRLCTKHLKNQLAPELENAQRKLRIVMGDSEPAAPDQPARTRGRVPKNTAPVSRPEDAFANLRKGPPARVSTAHTPAARTPRVHFTPSTRGPAGEASSFYPPSPPPAAARRAAPAPAPTRAPAARPPAVNDYTSRAYAPIIHPQQIHVGEAHIPPPAPLPPHLAFGFWEHTPEYGVQPGAQAHRRARAEPLTPPTSLPSPRDDTPDNDVTVGRYTAMNTTAATIYVPSDSESEISSDDDYDDSSEDEGNANSRVYPKGFWRRYDKKWDSLQDHGRVIGKALEEQIPWPVYGKMYPTPENVEAFYCNALVDFSSRSDRILVIGHECRRWAPKNLKKVLGKRIFKGMFAETLQMIYSVARGYHDRLISEERNNTEIVYKMYGRSTGTECLGYILFRGNDGRGIVEVVNRNSRLEPYHLDLGGSAKASNKSLAGVHGEGLKIALLVLQRDEQNHAIRCQTGGCSWLFNFTTQGKLVAMVSRLKDGKARNKERHPKGSIAPFNPCYKKDVRFIIGEIKKGKNDRGEEVRRSAVKREEFESWCNTVLSFQELNKDSVLKTRHGEIIMDPKHRGSLYLKGLLMRRSTRSCSASMTGRPLKYGYNFENGTTNRDRRALGSPEEEGRSILAIWQAALVERPELVGELSDILNSSDPQWAEVSMLGVGLLPGTADKLAQHLLSDTSKWYYSPREREENPGIDTVIASLGRQGFQLTVDYWDTLASYGLIRTAKKGQQGRFRSAATVTIPGDHFAQQMERMLQACLRALPQTSSAKLEFVKAGCLSLRAFFQDKDDGLVRVHERWLHRATVRGEFAFLEDVSDIYMSVHACKSLLKDIIEQLEDDPSVAHDSQASVKPKERQMVLAEQRLTEYAHQCSTLALKTIDKDSTIVVTWEVLNSSMGNPSFEVALHDASTCLCLKDKLLAQDIDENDSVCPSQVHSSQRRATQSAQTQACCRVETVKGKARVDESIKYAAKFCNVKRGTRYFAIVYRPEKPSSFVVVSNMSDLLSATPEASRVPSDARAEPQQTPSYHFTRSQAFPQTPSPFPAGQGIPHTRSVHVRSIPVPTFASGYYGSGPQWPSPQMVNQIPAELRRQVNYRHPAQAIPGYLRGNGVMGQPFQKASPH
ncbi:hypothetical protein CEP52_009561 [Fusarium oligoseptatum]|uniref:Uncharacterized protein n=1 Tax=Fusarium oligoseptatum TaxID=2604345 RepID=A0A428TCT0_9HYPO|nr:hypothetical protein CEP52_009561 [Fusarium oligoseptatum]